MNISEILNIILVTVGLAFGVYKWFYDKREQKVKEDKQEYKDSLKRHLDTGKGWVDALDVKVDREVGLLQSNLAANSDILEQVEKRTRILESQQMTERKVEEKLAPIKIEVAETKSDIRDLRDEFRTHASLAEMNTQQLLSGMSEIKGYLKAKSEGER